MTRKELQNNIVAAYRSLTTREKNMLKPDIRNETELLKFFDEFTLHQRIQFPEVLMKVGMTPDVANIASILNVFGGLLSESKVGEGSIKFEETIALLSSMVLNNLVSTYPDFQRFVPILKNLDLTVAHRTKPDDISYKDWRDNYFTPTLRESIGILESPVDYDPLERFELLGVITRDISSNREPSTLCYDNIKDPEHFAQLEFVMIKNGLLSIGTYRWKGHKVQLVAWAKYMNDKGIFNRHKETKSGKSILKVKDIKNYLSCRYLVNLTDVRFSTKSYDEVQSMIKSSLE